MRSEFWAWYPPTEDEQRLFAEQAMIAVDTNVLLGLYRSSSSTADALLELLRRLDDRVWIPHHVAFEYQRGRLRVIAQQSGLLDALLHKVKESQAALRQQLESHGNDIERHPGLDVAETLQWVEEAYSSLVNHIESKRNSVISSVRAVSATDHIHSTTTQLLDGHIGSPFTEEELKQLEDEGDQRFAEKKPPGYIDQDKRENKYGDFIIWKEMIRQSKTAARPLVFVTEEQKADWWRKDGGLVAGPLPALREEFRAEAGQLFWMYRVSQFMSLSETFTSKAIDAAAVEEIEERLQLDQQAERTFQLRQELLERETLVAALHTSLEAITTSEADQSLNADAKHQLRDRLDHELDMIAALKTLLRSQGNA